MNRREFFALGGAGAAAAGLSLAKAMNGGRDEPNLLVIITDDQPYYTVSHTKAVASLIRDRGTTFSPYAYVSTPICGPARATLLTGKWSHVTGLTKTAGAYQDLHASIYESDTIATRLKQAGYSTYFGGEVHQWLRRQCHTARVGCLVCDGGTPQQGRLVPLP